MAKCKYNPKTFPKRAEQYAREGKIDMQIAAKLGISESTYYDYQNKYPEFSEAIKRGKSVIDQEVESALLKRALGYKYEEIKTEIIDGQDKKPDKDGQMAKSKAGTRQKVTKVTKEVPADTTAAIFWVKNRMPDKWRDKVVNETHITDETMRKQTQDIFDSMSYEEKKKWLEEQCNKI
jgi:predicted DNA-binding transcriptional regulator AlpA